MHSASSLAVAYAINALWQLPLLVVAAEMVVRLLGRTRGKVLHFVWMGCLALALTVPALPFLRSQPFATHAEDALCCRCPSTWLCPRNIRGRSFGETDYEPA